MDWEAKALVPGASAESILRILDGLNTRKQAIINAGVITEPTIDEITTDVSLTDLWLSQPDDQARGALLRRMRYRVLVKRGPKYGTTSVRLQQGDKDWKDVARKYDSEADAIRADYNPAVDEPWEVES